MEKENPKGIISIFVLFAMLFLLIFVFTTYFFVQNKLKQMEKENTELKRIYSANLDLIDLNESSINNEVIPIYNIDELNIVGTGSFLKINSKIYQCGIGMSYILKDNIIVDIEEDVLTNRIKFNDYKLYSSTYHIDKFTYNIYYYKNNTYWRNIYYKNYSIEDIANLDYSEGEFSILEEYGNYNEYTYMMIWDENNAKNLEIITQKNKANSLGEIEVYSKNIEKVNKKDGDFYILINIGNKI